MAAKKPKSKYLVPAPISSSGVKRAAKSVFNLRIGLQIGEEGENFRSAIVGPEQGVPSAMIKSWPPVYSALGIERRRGKIRVGVDDDRFAGVGDAAMQITGGGWRYIDVSDGQRRQIGQLGRMAGRRP